MAMLIATANTSIGTSTTWGLCDSAANSQLVALTASTNTTTSNVFSSAFTVGAGVCDGIALYLKRVTSTGTFTVGLALNGTVNDRTVTVNASDLPADESWVFFKFGSTLTLTSVATVKVSIVGSSAGNVAVYRNATAGNWGRLLRTTTTQAPATGDTLLIAGEWTAAGTKTNRTVTMDYTSSAVAIGNNTGTATAPVQGTTQGLTGIAIGQNGTLNWGTSASTTYVLQMQGNLMVFSGGTYSQGTSGTPVPSTSTATLQFANGADGNFGFLAMNGSTVNIYGSSKWGTNIWQTLLAANASAAATSLTVADSTGWLSGELIALESTSQAPGECESKALSGNASGTTLSIAALTNAHYGTSPAQGACFNLTRNCQLINTSASFYFYVYIGDKVTFTALWTEFRYIGSASVTNKHGLYWAATTSGTFSIQYCSIHDTKFYGFEAIASSRAFSIDNTVFYNCGISGSNNQGVVNLVSGTPGAWTLTNFAICGIPVNTAIYVNSNAMVVSAMQYGRISGVVNSNAGGFFYGGGTIVGTVSDLTFRACIGQNIWNNNQVNAYWPVPLNNMVFGRCNPSGAVMNPWGRSIWNNLLMFGNGGVPIACSGGGQTYVDINDSTIAGDTTFASAQGMWLANQCLAILRNVSFNTTSGILVPCGSGVQISNGNYSTVNCWMFNCKVPNDPGHGNSMNDPDFGFYSSNHNQVAGAYNCYFKNGNISRDTTIYKTAAPSERLTPLTSNYVDTTLPFKSSKRQVAADSGGTKTISCYIRTSSVGDGAAYAGNNPRLWLRRDDGLGLTVDTLLATFAGTLADGNWYQVSGTTPSAAEDGAWTVWVDCTGNAGWINIDDWAVS